MTQYIDKSALVAEIEKRIKSYILLQQKPEMSDLQEELQYKIDCLNSIKGYILNTLEVKEVDFEKEIDKWWCSLYTDYSMMRVPNHKFVPEPAYIDSNFKQSEIGKTKIAFELWMDWQVDSDDIEWDADTIRNFARHFFELGLKAQKGE